MWLFCRSGFFSAVVNRNDHALVHVRSMLAGDLERLLEAHGLKGVAVTETRDADYRFRCDVRREDWKRIVAEEADGIDYANFKSEVSEYGYGFRDGAYMAVHRTMAAAKDAELARDAAQRRTRAEET